MSVERDEPQELWGLLVIGLLLGGILSFVATSLLWVGLVDWWSDRSTFFEARYEYYFRGSSERGYLDLCEDAAGKPGVIFKDECAPPLPSKENQE